MFRLQPLHINSLKAITHILCIGYIAAQYYWGFTDQLGADPVKELIHKMGIASLNLLLITLLVSPAAKLFKQGRLIETRRMFGLYAFAFAVIHLITYLLFDLQLDWGNLFEDIIERPYITVGFMAFILLLTMAVTSPVRIRNRLKSRWQTLHNSIYLTGCLVILHFFWSVKSDLLEPGIYLFLMLFLFYLRKEQAKYWINKQIKRLT